MNKRKTLEVLNKLANQLDDIGRQSEANVIDQLIAIAGSNLVPIGKPYPVGDRYFQKFQDTTNTSQGIVTKEVNADGSLKEETSLTPEKPKENKPSETWEEWFRRTWPGLLPALQSKPEEVNEELQTNSAKDGKESKVEKLLKEIQDRYNKLRDLGWEAEALFEPTEEMEATEVMELGEPDEIPTRMDIISNIDFESFPEDADWSDVSMWQNGLPLDNRF